MKKVDNIRQDHEKRLASLHELQEVDESKARLIEVNQSLIDHGKMAI